MFGYLTADPAQLTPKASTRYRAAYCGLCRTLHQTYGLAAHLALTYDMAFLLLLHASLYEPSEQGGRTRCLPHPCRAHSYFCCDATQYAAAMNVLLACEQALDSWQDDRNIWKYAASGALSPAARRAAAAYPRQAEAIRAGLAILHALEQSGRKDPDAAANAFGSILAEVFVQTEDHWSPTLRALGFALGKFLYLLDAVCDQADDLRRERYNPLPPDDGTHFAPLLTLLIGDATDLFERLPLVQDVSILRNILYSGLWQHYARRFAPERPTKESTP